MTSMSPLARAIAAQAAAAMNTQHGRIRHLCDCETQWWDDDPRSDCPSCGVECLPAANGVGLWDKVRGNPHEPTPAGFGGFEKLGL